MDTSSVRANIFWQLLHRFYRGFNIQLWQSAVLVAVLPAPAPGGHSALLCCRFLLYQVSAPMLLVGEYIKILKSEEGQMLRRKHQMTVKLLRQMLMDSGFPVVHCPNHIILVQVRKFMHIVLLHKLPMEYLVDRTVGSETGIWCLDKFFFTVYSLNT